MNAIRTGLGILVCGLLLAACQTVSDEDIQRMVDAEVAK